MWFQTVALTLLFFVISMGFGLFILALASRQLIERSLLNRLEVLILAFTIGAPGCGTFLQLLCLVQRELAIDLAVVLLISLVGLTATNRLWRPQRQDLRELALCTAFLVPLAAISWWASFGAFSRFPFADIGADVHWMKIAREFADTGIINPYASQTYSDLRAALAGLLSGTLGLDLLQFHWVYRYFSILLFGVVSYVFASSLFVDPKRKWFAVFFAVSTNTVALLTNGSLALASSFVFLTVLLRITTASTADRIFPRSTISIVFGAFTGATMAFLLNNNALLMAALPALLLCLNALSRVGSEAWGKAAARFFVSATWPAVLIFVHRSSYLFTAIVIACWLFYLAVEKVTSRPEARKIKWLWAAGLLLPSISGLVLLYIAAARSGYVPRGTANDLFSPITQLLLGRGLNQGDEIMLGAGPEVAAVEIVRAVGPSFTILIGVMYLWWCVKNPPARVLQLSAIPNDRNAIGRLLWSWVAAHVLSLAILTGFPFMYRILFVMLGLFAIATTELFFQLLVDPAPAPVAQLRRISGFALILITALTVGIYAFGWWPDLPYSTYQTILRPAQIAALTFITICAVLTFSHRRRLQILAATAVISLSVATDRTAMVNLFRVYSFGRPPDGSTLISHYNASDLGTDRWLHSHLRNSVAVTDPTTLAMAKAVGGVSGLYLFSNLDTVHPITAERVRDIISAIVRPEQNPLRTFMKTCATVAPLLSILNLEARAQMGALDLKDGMLKSVRPREQVAPTLGPRQEVVPEAGGREEALRFIQQEPIKRAMEILRTPYREWNLIAIINPRTMQWLQLSEGRRLSYFPIDQPLDTELMDRLSTGPFPLLFSDGQNAVIQIRCTQAPAG